MCRILMYIGNEVTDLWSLVNAHNMKRGQLFSVNGKEQLHGLGVAWSATPQSSGCVTTLRPPLHDLTTRRVCMVTQAKIALAHMRSCVCLC